MSRVPDGSIIDYPYLWLRQAQNGETEGRKHRPVCLALSMPIPETDNHVLYLLAISSQSPLADQAALEIPVTEIKRAGLQDWKSAWIYVNEFNRDLYPNSWYYEPSPAARGEFSPLFLTRIKIALTEQIRLAKQKKQQIAVIRHDPEQR